MSTWNFYLCGLKIFWQQKSGPEGRKGWETLFYICLENKNPKSPENDI